jgi:hypothetical protein
MSEVVLLLPNTDRLQQVGDGVRGCTWQCIPEDSQYLVEVEQPMT